MKTIRERAEEALKRAEAAWPPPWRPGHVETHKVFAIDDSLPWSPPEFVVAMANEKRGAGSRFVETASFIAAARGDVEDFAGAVLRLTGPEMREGIRRCVWACPTEGDLVSTIMALLLEVAG